MYIEVEKNNNIYSVTPNVQPVVTANTTIPMIFISTPSEPEFTSGSDLWLLFKEDGSFCTSANAFEAVYWLRWGSYGGGYRTCYTTLSSDTFPWNDEDYGRDISVQDNATITINGTSVTIVRDGTVADGTMQDKNVPFGTLTARGVSS